MADFQHRLNALFGRYRLALERHARFQLRRSAVPDGRMDADDAVQIALTKAYESWHTCHAPDDDAVVLAWLLRILSNVIRNAGRDLRQGLRDVRREQSLDADADGSSRHVDAWLAAEQSSPCKRLRVLETLEGILAAIEQLPEHLKDVVVLLYRGLTRREIADRLGLSLGQVNRRLAEAFRIMCRFLREGGHDSRRAD